MIQSLNIITDTDLELRKIPYQASWK